MRVPGQTTVVEYEAFGDAEVLQMRTRDLPRPGPREVTVEVISSGLSHIDGFIRSGSETEWDEEWPRRSGSDFAGVVVARGAEVAGFAVGSDVIGHVSSGAHATYLNVSDRVLVPKPREVTWETAGGLYLAGATALGTLDELRIGAGDTIVVSAAAGGVGSIEAQLAKHRGARVIGTCGERNFDYLRQLGITPVKYGDGLEERIRRAAGRPVTAMIDNFGKDGRDLAAALDVPPHRYRSSDDRRMLELRLLQGDPEAVAFGTDLLVRVTELARLHAFTLLISGLYPLTDIAEAYADLARLHARGKIVVATHPVTTFRTLKARDVHEAS
ncbi:NADP-dependent oxidoreductase [Microbacterium sp. 2FI]|uniref:NADP-dependent oxidoreductase n=1 Tax=Microbacterium sp. 2FI TaxID=2502193 RepID=UPI0010F7E81A|nr:NADP-dependent oxidoreductase [Microbacterium sp. 2FI]